MLWAQNSNFRFSNEWMQAFVHLFSLLKFGYDERRLDKSQKFRDMAACIPSGLGADRMTSLVLVDQ